MRQVPANARTGVLALAAYADCALPLPLGKHMLTPMLAGAILQALDVKPGDSAGSRHGLRVSVRLPGRAAATADRSKLHGELAPPHAATWARRASTASK